MPGSKGRLRLAPWDFVYAVALAIACLITYVIAIHGLNPFVERNNDLLGGMWAVVATVFVFRETRHDSLSAGIARLIATCVSFALCLPYLWIFPFTPVGMAILLGVGTVVMMLLGRRDDIITTAITTTVVTVVAALSGGLLCFPVCCAMYGTRLCSCLPPTWSRSRQLCWSGH